MFSMLKQELKYYVNNASELIVLSILFISITALVPFAFPQGKIPTGVAVAVLWLALVCAVQLACSHGWQRHSDSGELELFPLLPWLLEVTVLGKTLALVLVTFLQLLVLVPLASLWLAIPVEQWPQLWLGLGAAAVSLICLNQLAAGLMAGRRKAGALLGVVVLPFAIPVMIFGVSYCSQPQLWHPTMLFLIGNAVFLLPLHAVAVAAGLRYGH